MSMIASERQEIIMNFGQAPSLDDILTIARFVLNSLPEELSELFEELELDIQDFPDEVVEIEQNLEDPYDLLSLYLSAKELSPGVEKKDAEGNDTLVLYRRPVLDYWCENGERFEQVVRQVIIEELAGQHDFSEAEVDEMISRHHQGMF
ncbi:MAG: metallopeptidase family protein [Bdellovibrionales bacterium]